MNITARWDGKPDEGMLQKKGGRGFPYCVFMDGEGEVLKELRPSSEDTFRSGMKPISLLVNARAAAAKKKSKKNRTNLALIEAVFKPNEEHFAQLNKAANRKSVDKEIAALYKAMVKTWPIQKAVDSAGEVRRDAEAKKALDQKMYEFFKKKVLVEDTGSDLFDKFWLGTVEHAIVAKDKKTALAALDTIEKKYKDNQRAMNYFKGLREKADAI